jgi:D-alanyl-D-alanine carboxypeptidase
MQKTIKLLVLVCVLVLASTAMAAQGGFLEAKLKELLPTNADFAVSAVYMETGKKMLEINNIKTNSPSPQSSPPRGEEIKGQALVPASLVKLFTAGAVLERLSKDDIDMTTTILHDGIITNGIIEGSLYIKGRGNALLSTRDLAEAIKELKAKGIKKITGNVVADDSFFDIRAIKRTRRVLS